MMALLISILEMIAVTKDRIIPEKGYIRGNVRVISQKANAMKQDCSEEELIKFVEFIIKEYNLCLS